MQMGRNRNEQIDGCNPQKDMGKKEIITILVGFLRILSCFRLPYMIVLNVNR